VLGAEKSGLQIKVAGDLVEIRPGLGVPILFGAPQK